MANYVLRRRQVSQERRGDEIGDLGAMADAGVGRGRNEVFAEAGGCWTGFGVYPGGLRQDDGGCFGDEAGRGGTVSPGAMVLNRLRRCSAAPRSSTSVSYTHLTLPTKRIV